MAKFLITVNKANNIKNKAQKSNYLIRNFPLQLDMIYKDTKMNFRLTQ
jgi:hypothetical protein